MYNNSFVASIKVDGDFKKEDKLGVVSLPFDSEYEIYLKNEHKRHKALVEVLVDGELITRKGRIILNEGQYMNLDCFLDDLSHNHRFKFVKKGNCSPHNMDKKDKAEHSVVEVRFYKEKRVIESHHHHYHHPYIDIRPYTWPPQPWTPPIIWYAASNGAGDMNGTGNARGINPSNVTNSVYTSDLGNCSYTINNLNVSSKSYSCNSVPHLTNSEACATPDFGGFPINEGVTDKGSKSNQQFTYCAGFDTDDCVTIRIALSGYDLEKKTAARTLDNSYCYYCGKQYGPRDHYCPNCGKQIRD